MKKISYPGVAAAVRTSAALDERYQIRYLAERKNKKPSKLKGSLSY